jgi:hypothetical protein
MQHGYNSKFQTLDGERERERVQQFNVVLFL